MFLPTDDSSTGYAYEVHVDCRLCLSSIHTSNNDTDRLQVLGPGSILVYKELFGDIFDQRVPSNGIQYLIRRSHVVLSQEKIQK